MIEIVLSISLVAFFIFLQGFFSSCEMSFISTNKIKLQRKAQQKDKNAKIVFNFLKNPDKFLSTTLVGLNISVVAASSITSYIVADKLQMSDFYQALISAMIISPLIFLFGEITPMSLGREFSYIYPYKVAKYIKFAYFVLSPLVFISKNISSFISKLFFPESKKSPYVTKEEIKHLLKESHQNTAPVKKDFKKKMLTEVIDFTETTAKEVMIPLIDAQLISSNYTKKEILNVFNKVRKDKIPVFTDRVDNIIGVLDITDFWANINNIDQIEKYLISPYYVPENKLVDELLEELKKLGKFMAIVVDEFGGASGIIYFETIVSEIIAELKSMGSNAGLKYSKNIVKINDNVYKINGNTKLDEVNEKLGLNIPEDDYTNINGFLTNKKGRILQDNEEFIFENMKFIVIKATAKKIKEVSLTILK